MNNFCLDATAKTKIPSGTDVVVFSLACFVDVKTYSRKYTSFHFSGYIWNCERNIYTVGESTGFAD